MGKTTTGDLINGRYLLKQQLGGGGAAVVWLARDMNRDELVALKLLHARYRAVEAIRERMQLEAKLMTSLDHPHIARAIGFSLDTAHPYIAMEMIEGATLQQELGVRSATDDHMEMELISRLFGQLCSAVGHAHEQGVVHRDLKPANIMLQATEQGAQIKVLDFGIAKIVDQHPSAATTQGRMLGSVAFMSPEQARGDPVDHRTDLFSLGVILYEMLTLRRAWARSAQGQPIRAYSEPLRLKGDNTPQLLFKRIDTGDSIKVSSLRVPLGSTVDELLTRALARNPDHRFQAADELWSATRAVLEQETARISAEGLGDDKTVMRPPRNVQTELRTMVYDPTISRARLVVPTTEVYPRSEPAVLNPASTFLPPPPVLATSPRRARWLGPAIFIGGIGLGVVVTQTLNMMAKSESMIDVSQETSSVPPPTKSRPFGVVAGSKPVPPPDVDVDVEPEPKKPERVLRTRRRTVVEEPAKSPDDPATALPVKPESFARVDDLIRRARQSPDSPQAIRALSRGLASAVGELEDASRKRRLQQRLELALGDLDALEAIARELKRASQ